MAKQSPRRILVLMHSSLVPPSSLDGLSENEIKPWRTEYDVTTALEDIGHQVTKVGIEDDLGVLRSAIEETRPHIVFNLLEEFRGRALFDQHVVSYLELLDQRYTGCNPLGLTLAHDKALSKKILSYHRVRTPRFAVCPVHRRVKIPKELTFPLLVKSKFEEGSVAISQASIVHTQEALEERIEFVHTRVGSSAIIEQFIDGREIYVGILGNRRLTVLPPWELIAKNLPEGTPLIATDKVKWDYAYQEKWGIDTKAAELTAEQSQRLIRTSKRIYRILGLSGYARLDFRFTPLGNFYLLEANPNPDLMYGAELAESAEHAGITYEHLVSRIVSLGLRYKVEFEKW